MKKCSIFSFILVFLVFLSGGMVRAGYRCSPDTDLRRQARALLVERTNRGIPPQRGALRGFAEAWRSGEEKLVELYFEAGIVDFRDASGRTILHLGAENGGTG